MVFQKSNVQLWSWSDQIYLIARRKHYTIDNTSHMSNKLFYVQTETETLSVGKDSVHALVDGENKTLFVFKLNC